MCRCAWLAVPTNYDADGRLVHGWTVAGCQHCSIDGLQRCAPRTFGPKFASRHCSSRAAPPPPPRPGRRGWCRRRQGKSCRRSRSTGRRVTQEASRRVQQQQLNGHLALPPPPPTPTQLRDDNGFDVRRHRRVGLLPSDRPSRRTVLTQPASSRRHAARTPPPPPPPRRRQSHTVGQQVWTTARSQLAACRLTAPLCVVWYTLHIAAVDAAAGDNLHCK